MPYSRDISVPGEAVSLLTGNAHIHGQTPDIARYIDKDKRLISEDMETS